MASTASAPAVTGDADATGASAYAYDDEHWATYLRGRPTAPDSFFQRIATYHRSHGGAFDLVHDCGAGVAPHARRLADDFSHVLVSDFNASSIAIAQARLTDTSTFSFQSGPAETLSVPPASVDCVFAMTMMHFVDTDKAMQAFAAQLKPGGTLAFGTYAFYCFKDAQVQAMWDALLKEAFDATWKGPDGKYPDYMTDSLMAIDSGYRTIAVPAEFYTDIRRYRLNWYGDERAGHFFSHVDFSGPSRVGADDECIDEEDRDWHTEIDVQGVRDLLETFPSINPERYEHRFKDLEALVGTRKISVYCPVSLVLATRI